MRIQDIIFKADRQKSWIPKKKKNQKSFQEHLEESIDNKKSETKNQIKNQILDILIWPKI